MRPYVQREIFGEFEQEALERATWLVDNLSEHEDARGNEIRCHELARAVREVLAIDGARVVDGMVSAVEHSWIEIALAWRTRTAILDVYCPGRLPQVQLIHSTAIIRPLYEERALRTDIRFDVIKRLVDQMRSML
jgi:hypothetical protein